MRKEAKLRVQHATVNAFSGQGFCILFHRTVCVMMCLQDSVRNDVFYRTVCIVMGLQDSVHNDVFTGQCA